MSKMHHSSSVDKVIDSGPVIDRFEAQKIQIAK